MFEWLITAEPYKGFCYADHENHLKKMYNTHKQLLESVLFLRVKTPFTRHRIRAVTTSNSVSLRLYLHSPLFL